MSMMPWFAAKMVVSAVSGHMLGRWVPETVTTAAGETLTLRQAIEAGVLGFWDRPEGMWVVLGAWAVAGIVLAYVFRGWLTKGARFNKPVDEPAVEAEPAT
jgi:hypothetical protein